MSLVFVMRIKTNQPIDIEVFLSLLKERNISKHVKYLGKNDLSEALKSAK
jgi:hypothetical protein